MIVNNEMDSMLKEVALALFEYFPETFWRD
jgi:hypothetical protein